MGLHMDDLHAPTVASGPTTGGFTNGVSKDRLSLQELIAEKDRVEAELKALGQVLDSNDYKVLMVRIEKGLHEHHARLQEQAQNNTATSNALLSAGSAAPAALEAPFAKVNSVVAGSPAETAGLQVGDSITKFGWVDWTNHDKLARLPQVVSQNEGLPIIIKAMRPSAAGPSESIEMQLTPRRNWGGRGMLGCNLLPL
ncbi:putative 26S proteasome regulatory subunit [Didymosphaeria variabile]|uniref:Probable 26S proteasome regulatory subunit p27 n=1 Tax=Didymosphaeria variabile TaxID=1932322 RepID=A0A9W8XS89_9PLEO|nr:putative 26S proteasome regulatory subunit [Didymosphaeria variabile]KAJ4357208.1 putative 26S proteasome regulatory subunit [Didymosphaeria variabile]